MKKKFILFVLLALFLSGCGKNALVANVSGNENADGVSNAPNKEAPGTNEIIFTEGVWPDKDWENVEFPFEKDCIPDKETALSITGVLVTKFHQQSCFINYAPQSVFYDTEDKIWIVTFVESPDYPGACVSIAIRKENAEVVKMWVEE